MPQQINLFHPVLLSPRQHFPAPAMAQALGLWALALVALSGWVLWRTQALQAELAQAQTGQTAEQQQLQQALAQRTAAHGDPAAVQQELLGVQARLAERQRLLDQLGGAETTSPTALLNNLAQTLPPAVWLDQIRWSPAGWALQGQTLEPEALRQWLASQGPTHALRVARQGDGTAGWTFRAAQGGDMPEVSPR